MKLASIKLQHGQVQVVGPPELVAWIKLLQNTKKTPEDKQHIYNEQMANWYIICSVTGEQILLCDLHYWNVETGAVYKCPQVMPLHDRYEK